MGPPVSEPVSNPHVSAGKKPETDDPRPSVGTLRGLDWLNFFLADVQTGVGPFLAIYLAGYGWNEERVGVALTVGGIAGILAQTPAGALVDQVHRKRTLIAIGIGALALGALLVAFVPTFWSVMSAQVLIGATSSIFGAAICAISLGVVGHHLFDTRQGRNQSFNSAGNVVAVVSMGLLGYFISNRSIFFFVAVCTLPTLFALHRIRPDEIDYERARGAKEDGPDAKPVGARALFKERPLIIFLILRSDVSLCERRHAATPRGDAGQGSWSQINDVHVRVRRDHAAGYRHYRVMERMQGGHLG
jgi:MFS family permease